MLPSVIYDMEPYQYYFNSRDYYYMSGKDKAAQIIADGYDNIGGTLVGAYQAELAAKAAANAIRQVAKGIAVGEEQAALEQVKIAEQAAKNFGANSGRLLGDVSKLEAAEAKFVKDVLNSGRTVEIIQTSTGRTADFIIDGKVYELKTVSNIANTSPERLSGAISSRIMDGRGQSGMTREIAERAIIRAYGADDRIGSEIQEIKIITNDGTISISRRR